MIYSVEIFRAEHLFMTKIKLVLVEAIAVWAGSNVFLSHDLCDPMLFLLSPWVSSPGRPIGPSHF